MHITATALMWLHEINFDTHYFALQRFSFFHCDVFVVYISPLNANPAKWPNTLKQFVGNLPTNCLSVFDHFVNLAFKGLATATLLIVDCHWHKSQVLPYHNKFLKRCLLHSGLLLATYWVRYPQVVLFWEIKYLILHQNLQSHMPFRGV